MKELHCDMCNGACCVPPAMNNADAEWIKKNTDYKTVALHINYNMFEKSWDESGTFAARCPAFDCDANMCKIYQFRPTVCRLFGHDRRVPCFIANPKKIKYYQSRQATRIIKRLIENGW
jgi:Fe-S-cluster containining protein